VWALRVNELLEDTTLFLLAIVEEVLKRSLVQVFDDQLQKT